MAFFPDDMWNSFTLSPTCARVENEMDLDFNSIMDETFEDLEGLTTEMVSTHFDLTEHLIKEDFEDETITQIKEESEESFIKEELSLDIKDFKYDLIEDFGSSSIDFIVQDIKSDCMWSSTFNEKNLSMGRKRDISLTLSETSEGQIVIKDVDLLGTTPPVLESNTFFGGIMESSLQPSGSDSETESASTDEEIDVVSSDGSDESILRNSHSFKCHKKIQHIEPGSSLLLNRNRPSSQQQKNTENKGFLANHPTFIDHCYFSAPPPSPDRPKLENIRGMLTPTESSDDESINTKLHHCKITPTVSNSIDKRKIVQAVQSLIKNNQHSHKSNILKKGDIPDNIKFRFRMKFKPNSQRNSLLSINNRQQARRKSAILNPHCPPPIKESVTNGSKVKLSSSFEQKSLIKANSKNNLQSGKQASSKSSSQEYRPPREQKGRDVRDLHNSMERQRRVDLRKNFNQLKAVIPELAETEKASKLSILNKASDFCNNLTSADAKLRKEIERESGKNLLLRKKLVCLSSFFSSRSARMPSNRVSVLQARRVCANN